MNAFINVILGLVIIVLAYYSYRQHLSLQKALSAITEDNRNMSLALHAGGIDVWSYDVLTKEISTIAGKRMCPGAISLEECDRMFKGKDSIRFKKHLNLIISGKKTAMTSTYRFRYPGETDWCIIEKEMVGVKDEKGRVMKVIGTHKDITNEVELMKNLKKGLERNQFALDTAQMTLFEIDFRTNVCRSYDDPLANNEAMNINKFDTLHRKMHPEDVEKAKKEFRRIQRHSNIVANFIARMKYPDGKWHYCSFSARAFNIDAETGKVSTLLGFRRDITEQIQTQKRLEEEKEKAMKADRLKSAFLANMSHEIRTPLNAIVGFSNLLSMTDDKNEQKEFIEIINKNNDMLLRIINDIIDLSKIESDNVEIARDEINLVDTFNQVCETLRADVIHKGSNIDFIIDNPYKKCHAVIDSKRMWQVLSNFTTNAAKYTKEGYIKVGYRSERNGLLVYVEDTGCGIPKDQKERVFDRFVKLDSFTQGAGLGLSICKAIIKSSNGRIDIESEPGKGSTFSAWVPCEIEAEA
ncbi:MAG: hypothetical protein IKR18_06520 [Bacteroidaceae bacterium]|nr:hypothetical protein [Bacteroidaceae bacterium]